MEHSGKAKGAVGTAMPKAGESSLSASIRKAATQPGYGAHTTLESLKTKGRSQAFESVLGEDGTKTNDGGYKPLDGCSANLNVGNHQLREAE